MLVQIESTVEGITAEQALALVLAVVYLLVVVARYLKDRNKPQVKQASSLPSFGLNEAALDLIPAATPAPPSQAKTYTVSRPVPVQTVKIERQQHIEKKVYAASDCQPSTPTWPIVKMEYPSPKKESTLSLHSLLLIVKVQARVRAYLARKRYMDLIYREQNVDQMFRFDVQIRRLIYGNHQKFFSMYKQYITFPAQALDRPGTLKIAQDFNIMPKVCNRRELNDAIDQVASNRKNFSPGGPVLLSFENYLKLFILLSLRHVHNPTKDEAVYKFDGLLKIIETSDGHKKVSKQRSTTLVKRFTLLDSGELPDAEMVRTIDLSKVLQARKSSRGSPSGSAANLTKKTSRRNSRGRIGSGAASDGGVLDEPGGEFAIDLGDLDATPVCDEEDLAGVSLIPKTPSPTKTTANASRPTAKPLPRVRSQKSQESSPASGQNDTVA